MGSRSGQGSSHTIGVGKVAGNGCPSCGVVRIQHPPKQATRIAVCANGVREVVIQLGLGITPDVNNTIVGSICHDRKVQASLTAGMDTHNIRALSSSWHSHGSPGSTLVSRAIHSRQASIHHPNIDLAIIAHRQLDVSRCVDQLCNSRRLLPSRPTIIGDKYARSRGIVACHRPCCHIKAIGISWISGQIGIATLIQPSNIHLRKGCPGICTPPYRAIASNSPIDIPLVTRSRQDCSTTNRHPINVMPLQVGITSGGCPGCAAIGGD